MKQKPPAHQIIKKLQRVWDSCIHENQREVARNYIRLAIQRYDWEGYYSPTYFNFYGKPSLADIVLLIKSLSKSEIKKGIAEE